MAITTGTKRIMLNETGLEPSKKMFECYSSEMNLSFEIITSSTRNKFSQLLKRKKKKSKGDKP